MSQTNRKPFTDQENEIIQKRYGHIKTAEVAAQLDNRRAGQTKRQALKLGIDRVYTGGVRGGSDTTSIERQWQRFVDLNSKWLSRPLV